MAFIEGGSQPIDTGGVGVRPFLNTGTNPVETGRTPIVSTRSRSGELADAPRIVSTGIRGEQTSDRTLAVPQPSEKASDVTEAARVSPIRDTAEVAETVRLFGEQHYVRKAPVLGTLVKDEEGRDNIYTRWSSPRMTRNQELDGIAPRGATKVETTEHAGLVDLDTFLTTAQSELTKAGTDEAIDLAERARLLRENLRYIGQKEFERAAAGIGNLWKSYLQEDPKTHLLVPAGIIRNTDPSMKKSSEHVFDHVLSSFNEEEKAAYGNRIVRRIEDAPRGAKNTKGVLLDDWSLSGEQLQSGFGRMLTSGRRGSRIRDNVEVHLIGASSKQLEGLQLQGHTLPTYAYFHAGPDTGRVLTRGPLITGTHSSVDFAVEMPIETIVRALNELHPDKPVSMPGGTNIRRQYRQERMPKNLIPKQY